MDRVERAHDDVAEFEFIIDGSPAACSAGEALAACQRLQLHPRALARRYKLIGRRVPAGVWGACRRIAEHRTTSYLRDWLRIDPYGASSASACR